MFTLMVLTRNRPYFVMRLLGYYKECKIRGPIYIGDLSSGEHKNRNKEIADRFADELDIRYSSVEGETTFNAVNTLMRDVDTKYLAISQDTDFLVYETITECLAFLEAHQDYSVAQGLALGFHLYSFGPFGDFKSTGLSSQPILDQNTAIERLRTLLSGHYGFINGVFRTECLREINSQVEGIHQGYLLSDFIRSCLLVIQGKVKTLDSLFLVRQSRTDV